MSWHIKALDIESNGGQTSQGHVRLAREGGSKNGFISPKVLSRINQIKPHNIY